MTDSVDAELKKQLSTFLLHTYVKRKQAASFDSLKTSCDGKSIVLLVDFSENATIASQKEVQAAHWHHFQATPLPVLLHNFRLVSHSPVSSLPTSSTVTQSNQEINLAMNTLLHCT